MKCPTELGLQHIELDFDGEGLSTTGCDCRIDVDSQALDDLDSTPTEDGPEGEESYEAPDGDDE